MDVDMTERDPALVGLVGLAIDVLARRGIRILGYVVAFPIPASL